MAKNNFRPSLKRTAVLQIVAITIFASVLLFEGAESLRTTLGMVNHADQVISAERELIKLNIDMETGFRGYLYTGRAIFLDPYTAAQKVMDFKLDTLHMLLGDSSSQQQQLTDIRIALAPWRLEAGTLIAHRREYTRFDRDDIGINQSLHMKDEMDGLRAKYDMLIASAMEQRTVSAQRVGERSVRLSVSCFLFAFLGGGGLWFIFRRQLRTVTAAYQMSLEAERSIDALALQLALREKHDAVANYQGQIEAIDRSQMMIEFHMDGRIIKANDNYLRIFNYTKEDLKNKEHSFFVTEEEAGERSLPGVLGQPAGWRLSVWGVQADWQKPAGSMDRSNLPPDPR